MSFTKVTTQKLIDTQQRMLQIYEKYNESIETVVSLMLKLDDYLSFGQTQLIISNVEKRNLALSSESEKLRAQIDKLYSIANDYEETEKENTDESESIN